MLSSRPEHDSYIGRHFHEYRIDKLLGSGNMASVYLATDFRLQRKAAIKVNNQDFRDSEQYVKRVLLEGQVLAQLRHPHIVQAYRMGEIDHVLYLAMEYVEGADLAIVLNSYKEDGEYIEAHEALRIMREIGSALDYAHTEGYIHRDIKPSNIMLDTRGCSFLTDFGLVLVENLGTIGDVLGTPYYIAPEQAMSSGQATRQSDFYALGVIMYEMFTNRRPFYAKQPIALALKHVTDQPPPPRRYRPSISPEVQAVILKALEKKPEERYQSGAEMADALEYALEHGGVGEEVTATPIHEPTGTILARTLNFASEMDEESSPPTPIKPVNAEADPPADDPPDPDPPPPEADDPPPPEDGNSEAEMPSGIDTLRLNNLGLQS
jgi:serine/threonine protein kinase